MCLGTIGAEVQSKQPRNGAKGCFSLKTTVSGSGASADATRAKFCRARGWVSVSTFMQLKTTSSDVIGLPSWKVMPGNSLNV
jgi:hypothetical protein